jgi:hypothetical protein
VDGRRCALALAGPVGRRRLTYLKVPVAWAQSWSFSSRIDASTKASVAVRCIRRPTPRNAPSDGRMKLVFISMVTTPNSGVSLRAAAAIEMSSSVMQAPPCATSKVLKCSGAGV